MREPIHCWGMNHPADAATIRVHAEDLGVARNLGFQLAAEPDRLPIRRPFWSVDGLRPQVHRPRRSALCGDQLNTPVGIIAIRIDSGAGQPSAVRRDAVKEEMSITHWG